MPSLGPGKRALLCHFATGFLDSPDPSLEAVTPASAANATWILLSCVIDRNHQV